MYVITVQVVFQASQGHVVIDKEPLLAFSAVTYQIDEVRVMQMREHQNLDQKLLVPLVTRFIQLLDGYILLL